MVTDIQIYCAGKLKISEDSVLDINNVLFLPEVILIIQYVRFIYRTAYDFLIKTKVKQDT